MEDYSKEVQEEAKELEEAGVHEVKKGDTVVIQGKEVTIQSMATAKTGKHGAAKAMIVATDAATGKKFEMVLPASESI